MARFFSVQCRIHFSLRFCVDDGKVGSLRQHSPKILNEVKVKMKSLASEPHFHNLSQMKLDIVILECVCAVREEKKIH